MGQALHARATTTHRIRAEIQQSKESLVKIAKRYGINPKTVAKWRNRTTVEDEPMGKRIIKSTILTEREEEAIVKCRVLTKLALDDLFLALKEEIPHLTRSNLHRCLKRHKVSRLPKEDNPETPKKQFKTYEIGYFHIDTAEIRSEEGKAYLFVAIDRVSKFVVAKIYSRKSLHSSCDFLQYVMKTVPYVIHTILTDNGTEYTDSAFATPIKITKDVSSQERSDLLSDTVFQDDYQTSLSAAFKENSDIKSTPSLEKEVWIKKPSGHHAFDILCKDHAIDHRLTKVKHPWTNGQVERMNRSIKEETVKKYHYKTQEEMEKHLDTFISAYNCAKHLKSLNLKTPLEFLMQKFLKKPILFKRNPHLYYARPNN